MEKIKLSVKIYGRSERINTYLYGEFGMFEECATSLDCFEEYSAFLNKLCDEKINHKEIEVSKEVLINFLCDVQNRASIDYFEGHSDDEDITAGGKAMDRLEKRILKAHPEIKQSGFQRFSF